VAIYQSPTKIRLGIILLLVGLGGHLLAAGAMRGARLAYTHHVLGFVLILVVTAPVVAALHWRFWRGRGDVSLLVLGAVQAVFGIIVYAMQAAA